MYTIEIEYTTGNSFGSEQLTETVGPSWKSKELARKALTSIKEHYTFYQEKEGWHPEQTDKAIFKDVKKHDWYKNVPDREPQYWEYGLAVEMDDGSWKRMDTFWIGYFETLHGAAVICEGDDEDRVSF